MAQVLTPDLCVIGGGSGGLSLASGAAAFGVSVVLIERGRMGGDCLNYGCVPSKALLAAAKRAHDMRDAGKFGIRPIDPDIDHKAVAGHVHSVIAALSPQDSAERYNALGVDVIKASARFADKATVVAGAHRIKARRFIIATGSTPLIPAIPGLDRVPFYTNETIFDNNRRFAHLLVIGGGAVGLELAQAHRRLGSEVTVIEAERALQHDDAELSQHILRQMKEEGIRIIENARVERIEPFGANIQVIYASFGKSYTAEGTNLLLAAGRTPAIAGLDLDLAGIKYSEQGILVNRGLKTSNRRVYAIGDVTGAMNFTHVANYHAAVVLKNALFRLPVRVNHKTVPWVTFTDPELAHVGMTEDEARKKHGRLTILRWPYAENDRAHAERQTQGFVKVIATKNGKILGAGMAGAYAGELIQMWSLAMQKGISMRAMADFISPYPTLSEINKKAAMMNFAGVPQNVFCAASLDGWRNSARLFKPDLRKLSYFSNRKFFHLDPGNSADTGGSEAALRRFALGLPSKLLLLTAVFVMIAEVLIFVPSVANYRKNWLMNRLIAAQIASLSLEAADGAELPPRLRFELLNTAGVYAVSLKRDNVRQLVLQMTEERPISASYDLRDPGWLTLIMDGLNLFVTPPGRFIRVLGTPEMGAGDEIDVVIDETPLRAAVWNFAVNIFWLSIIISIFTAALVYLALNGLLVRPMMRLTKNMVSYRENPEDVSRIIAPSGREDEVGVAERELAAMQTQLSTFIRERSRLAALGLAVSKINHDLRNMLSSAQLVSDRLATVPDPTVQHFMPRLIRALDRAIALCVDILAYGRSTERPPKLLFFPLRPLIDEVADSLGLHDRADIAIHIDVPASLQLWADRDHLFRVLSNLARNAVDALGHADGERREAALHIHARDGDQVTIVRFSDNGPGIPEAFRKHLFKAFQSSSRTHGTGLGLAIAAELIAAHGGTIELEDTLQGASFRMTFPARHDFDGSVPSIQGESEKGKPANG